MVTRGDSAAPLLSAEGSHRDLTRTAPNFPPCQADRYCVPRRGTPGQQRQPSRAPPGSADSAPTRPDVAVTENARGSGPGAAAQPRAADPGRLGKSLRLVAHHALRRGRLTQGQRRRDRFRTEGRGPQAGPPGGEAVLERRGRRPDRYRLRAAGGTGGGVDHGTREHQQHEGAARPRSVVGGACRRRTTADPHTDRWRLAAGRAQRHRRGGDRPGRPAGGRLTRCAPPERRVGAGEREVRHAGLPRQQHPAGHARRADVGRGRGRAGRPVPVSVTQRRRRPHGGRSAAPWRPRDVGAVRPHHRRPGRRALRMRSRGMPGDRGIDRGRARRPRVRHGRAATGGRAGRGRPGRALGAGAVAPMSARCWPT